MVGVLAKITEDELERIRWEAQVELYNKVHDLAFSGDSQDPREVVRKVIRGMQSIRNELSLYEQRLGRRN